MQLLRRSLAAAAAALAGFAVPAMTAAQTPPRAHVEGGDLSGVRQGAVAAYLGVPFAAPPVGANRWRAPQPAPTWTGVKAADRFSPACMQAVSPQGRAPWTREFSHQGGVSEDCLYLNVWTPARAGADRLPVLVWIYGGGFRSGSTAVPIYDGRALAAEGVVVVSMNYRVGALGFLAHPELTAEAAGAPPGNYGLQDVVAALKWVRANIAAFGGDPNAVTIYGQSAGSSVVHDLMVSPGAWGLFQRAIAQSGTPAVGRTMSLSEAEAAGAAFARERGAASLAELRAMPAEKLIPDGRGAMTLFAPLADGVLLTEAPIALYREGRFAKAPILIGVARDDPSGFTPTTWGASDPKVAQTLLDQAYGPMAADFGRFYPRDSDPEREEASKQIMRDGSLGSLYAWADAWLTQGGGRAYAYEWTHVMPGPEAARWGAFHSSDIPYVFRTLDVAPERGFTDADRRVSRQMSGYWLNFVRTGDPNGKTLPAWPRLTSRLTILEIGDRTHPRPLLPADKLAAFKAFVAKGGEPRPF